MRIATFVIKVWRFLSMLFVLIISGFVYSTLPADVGVHFNASGVADEYMAKSDIFYILVAVVLVNNVLILALGRKLLEMPTRLLPIPNQKEWESNTELLNEHLLNWFLCIVAGINTVLGLTFMVLGTVNSNQFKYKISDFEWLPYLTIFILFSIAFSLPILLMMKPKADE